VAIISDLAWILITCLSLAGLNLVSNVLDSVGFHPIIKSWFSNRFRSPSPPQQAGWPSIAAGSHTLILAPTGSGKTLAAFLWCIDQLLRQSLKAGLPHFNAGFEGVHTLYISPLKALNNDIYHNLKAPLREIHRLAAGSNLEFPQIRVAVRTGDTPPHVRRSMMRLPPQILITTPESLYLLLGTERGRHLFSNLTYVIVDEIHAISNNKRGVHLSLSLERLMTLCRLEPIRIGLSATQKPLDRIAAFLGGQRFCGAKTKAVPRSVRIIDCGQRKDIDLKVITPVKTFGALPESSVWQPVYRNLYELIRTHKTTLVFVGMRAQTEKIARALNQLHRRITGDPDTELALAHHGSISREARYAIEARLKEGKIPAVIATASLELGIDIGSIDLVVQLEAPRNVSGALQRVGRSGHLLSATRKGRIVVLYPADLDDAVAIARCMVRADIEDTQIPENALDVLAQHIVAEVAVQPRDYEELFQLVRQSYCYRNLPRSAFNSVVEMLCGKFADIPLQALNARLNWDRVNNQLIARRGSRLAAVMNGGTIPDRGYYGVYLEDANVKLGEVEEEFAFESRVGEVFFLGNSEWLIKQILQDRIIVSPVAAINPRAPFWKGGILHRDYETSLKIGQFRRQLLQKLDRGRAATWLLQECAADENTASNLVDYFTRQRAKGELIATDKQVVAELSMDRGGLPVLVIHAPFGARVNGAWAIALTAALEEHFHTQIQYSFDDDGILMRLPDATEPPPLDRLFKLSARRLEAYLLQALPQSTVFQVHFRYNAARSLMLPRSHPGRRIPLWLQRLRASDLLQAVGSYQEFPVVVETYRECLQDVFDLAALRKIAGRIIRKQIRVDVVNTPAPSPMAAGILFRFVSVYLYEEDQSRRPREGLSVSSEILDSMLDTSRLPAILSAELVREAERRWQHLDPHFQATTAEDLFSIIEKLGPLDEENLARRCKVDPLPLLHELKKGGRIVLTDAQRGNQSFRSWKLKEKKPTIAGDDDRSGILRAVRRCLQSRGPVAIDTIETELDLPQHLIAEALNRLLARKQVIRGRFIEGLDEIQWCDRHNFTRLYRMAVGRRRVVQNPADRTTFMRFLLQWHRIAGPVQPLLEVIRQYGGYRFPVLFFEREVLSSRYRDLKPASYNERLVELEARISNGEIIACAGRSRDTDRTYVEFRMRGEGRMLVEQEELLGRAEHLSPSGKTAFEFLRHNGASYGRDLESGTGLTYPRLQHALHELAEKGLASCENYQSFLSILQPELKAGKIKAHILQLDGGSRRGVSKKHFPGPLKAEIRTRLRQRTQFKDGRWFLTASFGALGKPVDADQRVEWQARLLLARYGILVKEWYRREQGLLPWHPIFQVLKRLEWQGEIRRGYFVAGLSGVQFALPAAVELLFKVCEPAAGDEEPVLLSSLDPALPFGGGVDWGLSGREDSPVKVMRSAANHVVLVNGRIVLICENFFQRLTVLDELSSHKWRSLTALFAEYLKMPSLVRPVTRIEIHEINDLPAAASPIAGPLKEFGFEKDGTTLILWPSAV
jgi:ATP-dependent Lhr-like helicase